MFLLLFDNLTTLPDYTIPHPACELRFQLIFHLQQYPICLWQNRKLSGIGRIQNPDTPNCQIRFSPDIRRYSVPIGNLIIERMPGHVKLQVTDDIIIIITFPPT